MEYILDESRNWNSYMIYLSWIILDRIYIIAGKDCVGSLVE